VKAKTPYWPLGRVKALAADGAIYVMRARARNFFTSELEVHEAVAATVASLTVREYSDKSDQTDTCDVYGVVRAGGGWMLKIYIDEKVPELTVVSFHPLERPLKTNKGMLKP
jgi:hypothetical protein